MADTLLPNNASELERATEAAITTALNDIAVPLRDIWSPERCPAELLPWLAWTLSVDEWDQDWSEATQRNVIAASVAIHRHKGTLGSLRQALVAMGYSHVEVLETVKYLRDGTYSRDGTINHGHRIGAYQFDVELNAGFEPDAAQAAQIHDRINRYKNARSHLRELRYMTLQHNGLHTRAGSQNHNGGLVNG